jgi:hypothetical protein
MVMTKTTDSLSLDTNDDVLVVNQVTNNNFNLASVSGQTYIEAVGASVAALDHIAFFDAWAPQAAITAVGLLSNRPAPVSTQTYYATDVNTLFTANSTPVWDAGVVMNYVGTSKDLEINIGLVGQKFFNTTNNLVYTYTGRWEQAENLAGTVVQAGTAATTDVAAVITNVVATTATVVVGSYYFNSTDGYLYKGLVSASSAATTAANYQRISKPVFGAVGALPSAYAVRESTTDTFEILATVAALTPATSTIGFKADVELFDIAAGTYAYSVKTTFPDGRVVENADNATISASGNNVLGKVTPTSLSGNFANHWKLEVIGAVKGTYKFEFKFGPLSRTINVVVKDNSQAKVTNINVGTTAASLFNGNYLLLNATALVNRNVVASVTPTNIPSGVFYRITLSYAGTSPTGHYEWVDSANAALTGNALVSALTEIPEVFTTLTLGRLQDKAASTPNADQRAIVKIEWFTKNIIGVNLATGEQIIVYNQVGETQQFNFRFTV